MTLSDACDAIHTLLTPYLSDASHCYDSILWHCTSTHALHDLPDGALKESGAPVDLILVLLAVGEGRYQQLQLFPLSCCLLRQSRRGS